MRDLIQRADLNGDGVMDYGEHERLMNMEVYGDEAGGNLYVRQAIDLRILCPHSVLADCVIMVGYKGLDPLKLDKNLEELDTFREELDTFRESEIKLSVGPFLNACSRTWQRIWAPQTCLLQEDRRPRLSMVGLKTSSLSSFLAFWPSLVLSKRQCFRR